jgi:hypothetical protein
LGRFIVCAALCVAKSISFIRPRSCDVSGSHAADCLLAPWQASSRSAACRVISHYSIHHSTSILAPSSSAPIKSISALAQPIHCKLYANDHIDMSVPVSYFPSVRPSAIVLGTVFEHVSSFIVYGPLFGQTWQKAMNADKVCNLSRSELFNN